MTEDPQWWNQSAQGSGQQPPIGHPPYAPPQPHGYPPAAQPYEYPPLEAQQPFPGQYPPPNPYGTPPPRGSNTGLIVGLVLGGLVLVLVAVGVVVAVNKSGSGENSAAGTTTASAVRTSAASSAPTTAFTTAPPTAAQPGATTAAVVPGFQGVAVPARGIAYDVPAGWKIDKESMIRGFEDGRGNRISGTGTAVDGEDYCPSSNRTITFVSRSDQPNPATAATDVGRKAADYGFNAPSDATPTPPVPLTTSSGVAGQMVETSGSWHPDNPACTTTRFSVYTFAFPGPQNPTLVLTIAADRGVPGEITPDVARQIFTSIRKL
ncbi:hypothetical protein [Nocardia wallacei]|uniref:hypothetical protein n=1 Tax=Nocardia wallacei TaxID=480035 RepID=UPI002456C4B5|nr:hypothetical protein [Nocardia wallacei]